MVDVLSLYMEFVQVNCFKTKIDRLVIWRFDNTIWYNLDANRLCWPNEMTLKYRTFTHTHVYHVSPYVEPFRLHYHEDYQQHCNRTCYRCVHC